MSKDAETKNLIAALDIGTSKIVVLVGEIKPDGTLEVVGVGRHESAGVHMGMVINIEEAVSAIQYALDEAWLMAGCKVREFYLGNPGCFTKGSYAKTILTKCMHSCGLEVSLWL